MTIPILIPEGLWPQDQTGVVATWLYEHGDQVEEGAVIVEVMIDKTQIEIPAPGTGRLHILRQEEEQVACGEVIGELT